MPGIPMELLLASTVAMKKKVSGSSEPRKSWHKDCFDLDFHHCFFMFTLKENGTGWICWIIVLHWYPLGLFPHTTLPFLDTLAHIIQPRIKIMAQLKNLSSEAIHKIPFKMGFAHRAYYYVLCVCSIAWHQNQHIPYCNWYKVEQSAGNVVIAIEGPLF